jgi:predicted RNA-binding protein with PIN domain
VRAAEELRAERRARRSAEEEAAAARRRVDAVLADRAAGRRALAEATDELARLRAAVGQRPDLEKVARDMADATEAAAALAARLDAAGRALNPPDTGQPPEPPVPQPEPDPQPEAEPPPSTPRPPSPSARGSGSPRPRPHEGPRRPAPLPPGLRDDSPEAAEHLVRTEGTVVVVDGYNASLAWRPALPIAEQRRRLVDALEELAARTKSDVQVVFDGVEAAPSTPASGPRRLVRARFSPAEVEADDIVVGLVDELPPNRPVVVASNDRAVRERAQRRGANVISISQLMAVLRREV